MTNNREGRAWLSAALTEFGLDVPPSRANFVMFPLRDEREVDRVFNGMLRQGVIVRPLRGFGLPQCIRITVGTPEENASEVAALSGRLKTRPD